ncbi:hypothetical protein SAMD00019534_070950 [Acytostelium subglobosum LB1]|uniref:hypothetical protein n=1 Tax=Acytostelium subglobosum LB1 TaxID=1410327 RepID=UPI000644BE56|nr:hypothetical protein SAMD00019534_070950 [Acytostelium subglobosum LB1]GAM23920.1 hypothetical protein SAMD00019534_070950 [Acytostelium subglobosum LB1]|eukprot:XP_012752956.1 hypothetical protein SAMD00019534_070950 [Acytostelium subglobosum LB1]
MTSTSNTSSSSSSSISNGNNDVADHNPFLLHVHTCQNDIEAVTRLLDIPFYRDHIDLRDLHGYPASHYAIHFGYIAILQVLLKNGADPSKKSCAGWSCIQEALGRRDAALVSLLLNEAKIKIQREYHKRVPNLLKALKEMPDFEMDLKWEFKSWVPIVSRFCPYDNYKIFKRGSSFRINTTITGFEGITFKRGELSFIFDGDEQRLMSVDFIRKEYEELSLRGGDTKAIEDEEVEIMMGAKSITRVKVLPETIKFSAAKSWIGNEKVEKIGAWNAKIFNVTGFDLRIMSRKNPNDKVAKNATTALAPASPNPNSTSPQPQIRRDNFDIVEHETNVDKSKIKSQGLLCEGESVNVKHKNFEGTVWISQEFPRKITDILPIFEVLSPTHKLFGRLSDFISLKFPSDGFPVKFDIPVLPTITATVTFNNYVEKEVDKCQFELPSDFVKTKQLLK